MMECMTRFTLPENLGAYRIHMVGIKGTGMAALAELLVSRGAILSGSDVPEVFYTDEILKQLDIPVLSPFSASNVGAGVSLVIYSAAYKPETNQDLQEAQGRGIPCILDCDALGDRRRPRQDDHDGHGGHPDARDRP